MDLLAAVEQLADHCGGVKAMALLGNIARYVGTKAYYCMGFVRASLYGVRLAAGARVSPFARIRGAALVGNAVIGRDVHMGYASYINSGEITCGRIGRWCSIGYNVVIGPTEHDYGRASTSPHFPGNELLEADGVRTDRPPPVLEDDVWIGANVIILRGVRIGRGSVVAAGAVVTKDIPEYSLAVGVPARVVRSRFMLESNRARAAMLLEKATATAGASE